VGSNAAWYVVRLPALPTGVKGQRHVELEPLDIDQRVSAVFPLSSSAPGRAGGRSGGWRGAHRYEKQVDASAAATNAVVARAVERVALRAAGGCRLPVPSKRCCLGRAGGHNAAIGIHNAPAIRVHDGLVFSADSLKASGTCARAFT
jgi:hypothetical protein